ncbi:MAG TPA: hypothetical protein VIU46_01710 [Gallionellaceae bacterium]
MSASAACHSGSASTSPIFAHSTSQGAEISDASIATSRCASSRGLILPFSLQKLIWP